MSIIDQIQIQARQLSPEKQLEALGFIAFLQQRASTSELNRLKQKSQIKKAFATLAKLGTFADIIDPVEWQKQTHMDRLLPGRDN